MPFGPPAILSDRGKYPEKRKRAKSRSQEQSSAPRSTANAAKCASEVSRLSFRTPLWARIAGSNFRNDLIWRRAASEDIQLKANLPSESGSILWARIFPVRYAPFSLFFLPHAELFPEEQAG